MMNDVILNKISVIERCLQRIKIVYDDNTDNLTNFTKQDSIVLNIQRACEACIDLAMHVSAARKFGVPQIRTDAFDLLFSNDIISEQSTSNMKAMVGFCNIAVHDYQTI